MPFLSQLNLVRVALQICTVVSDYKSVLVPGEPILHLKLQKPVLIEIEVLNVVIGANAYLLRVSV